MLWPAGSSASIGGSAPSSNDAEPTSQPGSQRTRRPLRRAYGSGAVDGLDRLIPDETLTANPHAGDGLLAGTPELVRLRRLSEKKGRVQIGFAERVGVGRRRIGASRRTCCGPARTSRCRSYDAAPVASRVTETNWRAAFGQKVLLWLSRTGHHTATNSELRQQGPNSPSCRRDRG
jgi:hypothetical protein